MDNNLYKRLARAEAMTDAARAELDESLKTAYAAACKEGDTQSAAALARKIRKKMLDASDAQMSLDRLGLDTSSPIKFIASLAEIFSGDWAKYRQSLRDLTEQEGFPLNVTFPAAPPEISDKNN